MQRDGKEYRYARPIADALVADDKFRSWFISQTRFSAHAQTARVMNHEMKAQRTPKAEDWWRSHWAHKKTYKFFAECGERQTDLLAIFEGAFKFKFAIHVEVKAPGDKFQVNQARDYPKRATCWAGAGRAPPRVLPHDEATCVLLCEPEFKSGNSNESEWFEKVVSFKEIGVFISPYPDPAPTQKIEF